MFSIEQSGVITKTNTIDGLINEYIKRYVDNYVITSGVSSTITKEHLNELKTDLETKIRNAINDIDLSGYALKTDIKELPTDLINETTLATTLNDYALKTELPNDLINETTLATTLNDYALKTDIKELPNDLINETTLATTLNDYALKTDIKELPNDLINETTLATALNDYALKDDLTDYRKTTDLEYRYDQHLTVINELAVLEPYESGYTYIIRTERGEFEFKDAEEHDNWVIVKPNKIIDCIDEVDEIIIIYWYSQSYYPNQTFVALTSDYSQRNINHIKEVIRRKEDKIVLKSEVPDDLINETTLATTLNDYALKTDLVNEYRTKSDLTYDVYQQLETSFDGGYVYVYPIIRDTFIKECPKNVFTTE
ncbi:hypothetical protein M9Y10_023923 [Tritrichomonas musculus]|uniref:Uncharacterized protein n=1 Tax=Tritrichomonas musculus TaxID=1915356 RepID=A0ABR2KX80_9EUKA